MAKLAVRLLGGYRVELDGEPVYSFETDKARALLAYLMVEADRPHRRESLAGLLWPDRPDDVARVNLRTALARVRRALRDHQPSPFIFVTRTDVQFNAASDYSLDVGELEAYTRDHIARHEGAPPAPRPLQLLPEAFCADFLAGFSVPDSEAFEAWVLNRQEQFHRLAVDILSAQNVAFEAAGDYERAVAAARLQLRLEPWLEEAHERCMRGLALAGRRDEALHQYELCCRSVEAELGVAPAASTRALYAAIRDGKIVPTGPSGAGFSRLTELRSPDRPGAPDQSGPDRSSSPVARGQPHILVARDDELGQLGRHLEAALAGKTSLAFVSGDAGSGKTALLEAFAGSAMAGHPDLIVAGARCSPGGSQDALAPLRRLAEMLFGDLANDVAWWMAGLEQAERLRRATGLLLTSVAKHGRDLTDTLVPATSLAARGLSPGLTTAGRGNEPDRPALSAQLSQTALFDQLLRTLAAIAREQPLLLMVDDLQWVDDATAGFFLHIGRELPDSRLLVLGAYRSRTVSLGRRDPRTGEAVRHPLAVAVNELRQVKGDILIELDRADGRSFVEAYVDAEPNRLGARFRDALYAQTGGHALFTVELLRTLQSRGQLVKDEAGRWIAPASLDWGTLPARVEAAIAERIERLPALERRILSCASVQGDDFSGEVAAELAGAPVSEVLACLSGSLARQHGLLRPEGLRHVAGARRSIYRFAHHLFQKYLYDQLDPVERGEMHAAVGAVLDRQAGNDPADRERMGAQLAWHYEAAGLALEAARALLDAGHGAIRVGAYSDALGLFERGLALLASTDARNTTEGTALERMLQVARLVPQRGLGSSGSKELEDSLARVIEAGAGGAEERTRLVTLSAEADHLVAKGRFDELLVVAGRMLDLATLRRDEGYAAFAHFWFGFSYNLMGLPPQAESHFEWILERQAPGRWTDMRAALGYDILPHTLTFSALNNWFLGHPEAAHRHSAGALISARELGDVYGLAFASAIGCVTLFLLRADTSALDERSDFARRHCQEHGFAWWQHYAEVFRGWVAVRRGEGRSGIESMQAALLAWQDTGMVVGTDPLIVVLADACLVAASHRPPDDNAERARLVSIGLEAVEQWIGPNVACGQAYQAELHRLRGELLLARDGLAVAGEALASFERALETAQENGTLAWELRAAMSLVRLRARECAERASAERQGEACAAELTKARECLAEVYGKFTEGFAFPDLQDATALIGAGKEVPGRA